MIAVEVGSSGAALTSWFHQLVDGNTCRPTSGSFSTTPDWAASIAAEHTTTPHVISRRIGIAVARIPTIRADETFARYAIDGSNNRKDV